MPEFEFTVEPYLSGVRVDSFLARHFRNYTSWRLHRLVCAGLVTVNGLTAEPDRRVHRGDRVSIRLNEPPDKLLLQGHNAAIILYEDPWLMVIDKPAGVVAHPVGEFQENCLTNSLQAHLDGQTVARGLMRAGIVHRLDRMTSGLLVVPKEHLSHRLLSIDFQNGRPQKKYLTLVDGQPDFDRHSEVTPIGRHPDGGAVLMSARRDALKPRSARTDFTVLRRFESGALIECTLFTGRNHQIRVHLAHLGYPVMGDEFYRRNGVAEKGAGRSDKRHALHASTLSFQHPVLGVPIAVHSAPPQDFWDCLTD